MGVAREAIDHADGGAGQTFCLKSSSGNPCWAGQNDAAMEVLGSPPVCLNKADTAVETAKPQISLESCLQEEWLEQQRKKRIPDTVEGKPPPKQLKRESEETCRQGALGMFLEDFLAVITTSCCLGQADDIGPCLKVLFGGGKR